METQAVAETGGDADVTVLCQVLHAQMVGDREGNPNGHTAPQLICGGCTLHFKKNAILRLS